jgi:hypothetical protein
MDTWWLAWWIPILDAWSLVASLVNNYLGGLASLVDSLKKCLVSWMLGKLVAWILGCLEASKEDSLLGCWLALRIACLDAG